MNLLRAGEQARAQQELDARKGAAAMAQALRVLLQQEAALQLASPTERFTVTNGRIDVPPFVGWLAAAPALVPDPLVAARLDAAARAEFGAGDAAAAVLVFDALLGDQGPEGRARLPVLAAAAWQAHRHGNAERRDALAAALHAALTTMLRDLLAAADVAEAVAAAVLLDAARGVQPAAHAADLVPLLPAAIAQPLFARLSERGVAMSEWGTAHQLAVTRRTMLQRAQQAIDRGGPAGARALGPFVLLWFPLAEQGSGHGAVVASVALAQRAASEPVRGLPEVPQLGESVYQWSANAVEPVVDGVWWIAPQHRVLDVPLFARPGAALAAAAVLLLLLAGSGLFATRALRQQALAVQARAEFLTVVTHELKTPLAAIRLLAEMFVDARVPVGKADEYYRLLAGEAARLSMLIENVLDLGRMERGERAYDLRACDLGELAREAAVLFAPLAQRDGLRLQAHVEAAEVPGRADRGALLQALLNVLDNARKYGARGQVIELRATATAAGFELSIRDFGDGVPAQEREAIFARFQRGSAHRHGAIPGVGLGLHLARTIVQRHGGELRCRASHDGGPGAEFVFVLPLAATAAEVPA